MILLLPDKLSSKYFPPPRGGSLPTFYYAKPKGRFSAQRLFIYLLSQIKHVKNNNNGRK